MLRYVGWGTCFTSENLKDEHTPKDVKLYFNKVIETRTFFGGRLAGELSTAYGENYSGSIEEKHFPGVERLNISIIPLLSA